MNLIAIFVETNNYQFPLHAQRRTSADHFE